MILVGGLLKWPDGDTIGEEQLGTLAQGRGHVMLELYPVSFMVCL